ncbi:hypothetical protein BC938DRAFT_477123 [Jimgerdemannia flammicorona]|uniref:Uncharacterized protein n=1 Tax=Jimgerdemannia flammicorona TaxID=994334 RepID=A0A433QPP4_9FUNG|nr:hypothetical protein BC938DRAFT_477123 [Jimgerdemannia flammicorona]
MFMSTRKQKALAGAKKFRVATLFTPLKVAFQSIPRKSAPTESTSSATSVFAEVAYLPAEVADLPAEVSVLPSEAADLFAEIAILSAEVAASQAVVGEVMKYYLPLILVADNVVPANLRELLNTWLDVIATGPDKDYLPGTGDMVQALIHPSLFPIS